MSKNSKDKGVVPHGNFVGNGGQAYEVDGQLVPRDLFEQKLHRDAYIGSSEDPEIRKGVDCLILPAELGFDAQLLARKLTDINLAVPKLGECLLMSLLKYSWLVSEAPLPRTHEGDNLLTTDTMAPIVQIVNRIQNKLHIHRSSWARLSPIHRIALMIHESVYSLLKVTEVSDDTYQQYGPLARQIAGSFFDPNTMKNSGRVFEHVKNDLEIVFEPSMKKIETQFYAYRTTSGADQYGVRAVAPSLS